MNIAAAAAAVADASMHTYSHIDLEYFSNSNATQQWTTSNSGH